MTLPRPALFVSSHYSCSDEESKLDKNQSLIMILQDFRFCKLIFWPGAVLSSHFKCMKSSLYWVKRTPNNKPLSCLICISWQGDKSVFIWHQSSGQSEVSNNFGWINNDGLVWCQNSWFEFSDLIICDGDCDWHFVTPPRSALIDHWHLMSSRSLPDCPNDNLVSK